jgi:hypothetical protein
MRCFFRKKRGKKKRKGRNLDIIQLIEDCERKQKMVENTVFPLI